jgi:type II secretory pathway component PulM
MRALVSTWLAGLTPRERVLVLTALAIAGALLLVYGIALPLAGAYSAAHERHRHVVEQSARVLAALDSIEHAPRATALALPLDRAVSASADKAGVVLQSVQPRGANEAVVMLAGARPVSVLAWLDALPREGIVVSQATMTPGPDGSLAVSATLHAGATP